MGETKKMQKRSKWQQTKLEMKKYRMSYVMIAPYFILFFLFTVLPVLASIGISFTDFNMLETPNFVGWRNYIKLLLDDDVFKKAFKNTIIFAVITGPLSYIMCFLFAWIINEFKGKLRAFLTLIFYARADSVDENRKICAADPYYRTALAESWNRIFDLYRRSADGRQESLRGWCDGWHQKPLAGIVVHYPTKYETDAVIRCDYVNYPGI